MQQFCTPPKLGLGTAQMGLDYGITNATGKISQECACEITRTALQQGMDILDTAPSYGNAEEILGECLKGTTSNVDIVTKSPTSLRSYSSNNLTKMLEVSLEKSLESLDRKSVYGYLAHHMGDLLSENGKFIWNAIINFQERGIVQKIGFSAYTAKEIEQALKVFNPDIVQIPINALDRRLIKSGTLFRLREAGVEIHARSLFLQGVLLQPLQWFQGFFAPLARPVSILDEISRELGITRMALLLGLVWQMGMADYLIVGVANKHQLLELLQAREQAISMPAVNLPDEAYQIDEQLLNPTQWPK